MTTPVDITAIIPSKAKTWVGLIGSLLSFVVPFVLQYSADLPAPWPVIIGAVIAVLTALGIYHAPYTPAGTVLAPEEAVTQPAPALPAATPDHPVTPAVAPKVIDGEYQNPWK